MRRFSTIVRQPPFNVYFVIMEANDILQSFNCPSGPSESRYAILHQRRVRLLLVVIDRR